MSKTRWDKNDKKTVLVRIICLVLAITLAAGTIVAVILALINGI